MREGGEGRGREGEGEGGGREREVGDETGVIIVAGKR